MRCEDMRCEREMRRSPGWATPGDLVARGAGGTWGALGHFRGVPQGSQGGKCSLLEQKGGMDIKRGQIWRKVLAFGSKRGKSTSKKKKIEDIRKFCQIGRIRPKKGSVTRRRRRTPLYWCSELEDPVGPQNTAGRCSILPQAGPRVSQSAAL